MAKIKLSEYARRNGVTRQTAYKWWRDGKLNGIQLDTGTILIEEEETTANSVALYARVSSSQNKKDLETQMERLRLYAAAKGYKITKEIQEIGSGLNDHRPKLQKLLEDKTIGTIIVEHKDRLTRFGFNYIETLLKNNNRKVEVINETSDETDLLDDLVSIVTSFCARIYGQRRCKRKTEIIIKELTDEES